MALLEASGARIDAARAALAASRERLEGVGDVSYDEAHALCVTCVELEAALVRDPAARVAAIAQAQENAATLLATRSAESAVVRAPSVYARWILRHLSHYTEAAAKRRGVRPRSSAPRHANELVIDEQARWFRTPGGERVSLHRRRPIGRVLHALAEHRVSAPGSALTLEALVHRGWPGENPDATSGASRAYNALTTLRKAGLRDLLLSREGGYLLDPSVPVRLVEED
jgi:hypothetical protein